MWVNVWFCHPKRGCLVNCWPWFAELYNQWLDKDIRSMLIKFADDKESLGRADVLHDRIDTPHLLYSWTSR